MKGPWEVHMFIMITLRHDITEILLKVVLNQEVCNLSDLLWFDWFIVFNATFSKISAISWRPVLVVEEAGVPGENHWPRACNW